MKTTNKRYEAPKAEIVALEHQSVLCASGNNPTPSAPGAGLQGMTGGSTHGW
jgi:hypothetical protein